MSHASTDSTVAPAASTPRSTLRVRGELDLVTGPQLRERLDSFVDRSSGDVTVDMAQVRFLDAAGITVLVDAQQRLLARGRRLAISRASTRTLRVLRLAGVSALFNAAAPTGDVTAD